MLFNKYKVDRCSKMPPFFLWLSPKQKCRCVCIQGVRNYLIQQEHSWQVHWICSCLLPGNLWHTFICKKQEFWKKRIHEVQSHIKNRSLKFKATIRRIHSTCLVYTALATTWTCAITDLIKATSTLPFLFYHTRSVLDVHNSSTEAWRGDAATENTAHEHVALRHIRCDDMPWSVLLDSISTCVTGSIIKDLPRSTNLGMAF